MHPVSSAIAAACSGSKGMLGANHHAGGAHEAVGVAAFEAGLQGGRRWRRRARGRCGGGGLRWSAHFDLLAPLAIFFAAFA